MSFIKNLILSNKFRFIKIAVLFYILALLGNFTYRIFEHQTAEQFVMGSDTEGYYQYTPFFFLHNWDDFNRLPYAKSFEEGKTLNVYTCGVAIMQAPFFLIAHGISLLLGLDHDGYSPVYFTFVFYASIFYVLIGLIFLYKALLRYFKPKTAFWTSFLVFYATNLFFYTIVSPGMSHAYSFSLMAIFIYMVPVFYEKPNWKNAIFMALPISMATLIRPTNIIASLYFIFFGVSTMSLFKERILFFLKRWDLVLIILLVGIVVFTPQMAYWKFVTGKWLYYSYQSEGFPYLSSPRIGTVLWGARNGWFIYTPAMFIATLGLLYLLPRSRYNSWPTLAILILIVYIDASWWAPTFSAAAGYRALIEYIPFMAIPLGFVYEKTFETRKSWARFLAVVLILVLLFYNIQFTFKYSVWLWWDTDWQWKYLLRLFEF